MAAERKVALVTGGGKRRIGSHVAEALADRGCSVVVHYRTAEREAEAAVAGFRAGASSPWPWGRI